MRASNIALLVLAASAAAPVFSAPHSGHARSDLLISNRELGASVSGNERRVIESPISRDDDGSSTYSPEIFHEALDRLAARNDVEDFVKAVLSSRDYTARQVAQEDRGFTLFPISRDIEIQARSGFVNFFKNLGRSILGIFGINVRRDVDDMDKLVKALLQSRDELETHESNNQDASDLKLMNSRRAMPPIPGVPPGIQFALSLLGIRSFDELD